MRALCILRSMCDVKKKCRKTKKKKESNRNFVKSPNEGGNKELIAVPRLGNPVKRSGPWFSIWQWTRRDSDALIWGKKKPKPLIDFINFVAFSQWEGLSACVFYVCHGLPQGNGALLKGFWRRIKAFLSRGGRNTIVMTCCHPRMHLPTGALSSRPRHWGGKPAAPAVCYQSAWDRFSLPDISEGGRPLCPLLSALVFSEVATSTGASVAYLLSERMKREGGFRNDVLKISWTTECSEKRNQIKLQSKHSLICSHFLGRYKENFLNCIRRTTSCIGAKNDCIWNRSLCRSKDHFWILFSQVGLKLQNKT